MAIRPLFLRLRELIKHRIYGCCSLVSCQEGGHTLGLDHQDENFNNANLGTCMDYTKNPSTNQHPNKHDYDQLLSTYSHFDNRLNLLCGLAHRRISPGNVNPACSWMGARGQRALHERRVRLCPQRRARFTILMEDDMRSRALDQGHSVIVHLPNVGDEAKNRAPAPRM